MILTDENPPVRVKGSFRVEKLADDGTASPVQVYARVEGIPYRGYEWRTTFDTARGIVVTPGKYRVTVSYRNAAGVTKTVNYEQTL